MMTELFGQACRRDEYMGSVPVKLLGKIALNELNCLELWPSSVEARGILVIFALFLP
ncbi:MAG: hypothetical protein GY738_26740 [Pseudoalteromonas sp.]|nr:hypothetical protein [Pseudoalteromonas sp.]